MPRLTSTEELLRYLPDLRTLGTDYVVDSLYEMDGATPVAPINSSDMTSLYWRYIAATIERVYDDYDGFVILHGTDTMAYTASALSFMLGNLAKPVVMTGSQLPITHVRSDAVTNFVYSISLAGHHASGLPLIPEVSVCFGRAILRGNRTRKMSTTLSEGFTSPNYPPLGNIGRNIKVNVKHVRPTPNAAEETFFVRLDLDPTVVDIALYPGIQASHLELLLASNASRGVVLRTFGTGNAPTDPAFLRIIEDAVRRDKIIVNITQCPQGAVEADPRKEPGALVDRGVICGFDMTPEAAFTKLMLLLPDTPTAKVAAQMQEDYRGEISASVERTFDFASLSKPSRRLATPDDSLRVASSHFAGNLG